MRLLGNGTLSGGRFTSWRMRYETSCSARQRCWLLAILISLVLCSPRSPVAAEEPCQAFVDVLREERLFDVAIEYLDAMASSPLAPADFKERIPLHKVAVLLDEAGLIRDNDRLTSQLDRTEQILSEFIAANPATSLLAEAQEQRARIFMARAGRLLSQAESDRITVQLKTEKQEQSRRYLEQAAQAYEEIRQRLREELEKDLDPQNADANTEREKLRNKYVLVRLQSPRIKESIADSFGTGHPDYIRLLREAAAENLELYEKYRTRLSGIDGCLGAARCYAKLGEPDKALGHLGEVFDLPRGPVQIAKKREAAAIAIDCWEQMQPYPLEEAFQRLRQVIYSMPPEYSRSAEGIKVRMAFAQTCLQMAANIESAGGARDPESRKRLTELKKEATRILRSLVRLPGSHRQVAETYLTELGNSVAPAVEESKGPPETMADALQRGKDMQLQVAQLKSRLDAAEGTDDEAQIRQLRQQVESESEKALAMFELALSLTNDESADDDLSNIRYLQCASYYQMEMFFEAAIIGEYVLENYPNSSGAQPAAGLVCKAYWNLYREAGQATSDGVAEDRSFERQRLVSLCTDLLQTWPGSRQAEQAALVMTLLSLSEGDALAADRYLAEIPQDSPTRSAVVLEVGNRLWQTCVRGKRQGNLAADEYSATRDQARKLLENGVSWLKSDNLSIYEARSVLALAELYLDADQADQAIELLELATVAPLDLIKNKHEVAQDDRFRRDTYKTSIRAYLAKLRDAENSLSWVEKSQAVLAALKDDIGDSTEGQKQLSDIYLTLASELKQQFDSLQNNDQRQAFAAGLESFLTGLGTTASDRNLMLLTGSMTSEIGQGLKEAGLDTASRRFFDQAVKVYQTLSATKEPDDRIRLEIQRGLANSLRGTGEYEQAIRVFGDMLAIDDNRRFTDLQVEAARVYAEWGLEKGEPDILVKAIRGGEPRTAADGAQVTTIMGWVNLAKAAQRSRKNALLAEAIFNIARCKFRYGKIRKQDKLQQSAIDEIVKFKARVPDMGGPPWKSRLEELLVQMQQDKG